MYHIIQNGHHSKIYTQCWRECGENRTLLHWIKYIIYLKHRNSGEVIGGHIKGVQALHTL